MPGGRPGRPGEPRNPARLAAIPKGLAKLRAAVEEAREEGARGEELETPGEVGRARGEEDWPIMGD